MCLVWNWETMGFTPLTAHKRCAGEIILSNFQMRKTRLREAQHFAPGQQCQKAKRAPEARTPEVQNTLSHAALPMSFGEHGFCSFGFDFLKFRYS